MRGNIRFKEKLLQLFLLFSYLASMAVKRKTWEEKLHNGAVAKVEVTDKKFADIPEGVTMLVGTPEMVAEYIAAIPEGVHTSLQQMRRDLAAEHNAQYTCPVTSGIFLRIVAEAAYEEHIGGRQLEEVVPFWRMIDGKAPVGKKLTFGTDMIPAAAGKGRAGLLTPLPAL